MDYSINTTQTTQTQASYKTKVAISTTVVGSLLVYLMALSSPMHIHNAAHDVRHSASFPCH